MVLYYRYKCIFVGIQCVHNKYRQVAQSSTHAHLLNIYVCKSLCMRSHSNSTAALTSVQKRMYIYAFYAYVMHVSMYYSFLYLAVVVSVEFIEYPTAITKRTIRKKCKMAANKTRQPCLVVLTVRNDWDAIISGNYNFIFNWRIATYGGIH